MGKRACVPCTVQQSILELFDARAKEGEVAQWVEGTIGAAAHLAASHAKPGHEKIVRDKCTEQFRKSFDLILSVVIADEASGTTRQ